MSLLSNAFNCPTQEKHGFQSQEWSSAGVSITIVAGHAFSGCRSLTFNITERWEVESQVPYMHIWPPANVRGGRSRTLLLTLLQWCTIASIPELKHRIAMWFCKCVCTTLEENRFKFKTKGKECKHFSLVIELIFLLAIIKNNLQETLARKCLHLPIQTQIQPCFFLPKATFDSTYNNV